MQDFNHPKVIAECDSVQEAMRAASAGSDQSIRSAIDKIQLKFVTELNVITHSCRTILNETQKFRDAEPLAYDDELIQRHRRELLAEKTNTEVQHTQEGKGLVSDRHRRFLELNSFKAKNNLVGDAVEAGNFWLHGGIFLALLLGETVINGWFFAQTNERGILGGAGQAFIFSFINILMAVLFAYWIRYVNHNRLMPQILGYLGVISYIVTTVFYNCFVGHYRNVLEANLDMEISGLLINDASRQAWDNFTANPLGVGDVESLTLVLIGIILSIFAVYKTYSNGDAYPGYASSQKRFAVAARKLTGFRNSREQPDLAEVYVESLKELTLEKTIAQARITDFQSSLTNARAERNRLDEHIAEAKSAFKAELNKFDLAYQQHSAQNLPQDVKIDSYVANLAPSTILPEPDFAPDVEKFREGEPRVSKLISAISLEINEKFKEKEKALKTLEASWTASDQIYMNSAVFLREAEVNKNG